MESDEGPRGVAETINNARLRASCGRSRGAISGLGLVWIGLQDGGEATSGANGKQEMSMNEGIFARIWPLSGRIMTAAVYERKG